MARSASPTVYSDFDSEWTLAMNVDDEPNFRAFSRQSAISATELEHAQFLQVLHDKMFGGSLTSQSFVIRPNTPIDPVTDTWRPSTNLPSFDTPKEVGDITEVTIVVRFKCLL